MGAHAIENEVADLIIKNGTETHVREIVAQVLGQMGERGAAHAEVVANLLMDPNSTVRCAAA